MLPSTAWVDIAPWCGSCRKSHHTADPVRAVEGLTLAFSKRQSAKQTGGDFNVRRFDLTNFRYGEVDDACFRGSKGEMKIEDSRAHDLRLQCKYPKRKGSVNPHL